MDRNIKLDVSYNIKETSLSARRAWIEISGYFRFSRLDVVALRKESVDRNLLLSLLPALVWWSLSARRAWIEMDSD